MSSVHRLLGLPFAVDEPLYRIDVDRLSAPTRPKCPSSLHEVTTLNFHRESPWWVESPSDIFIHQFIHAVISKAVILFLSEYMSVLQ